jgi:hypothetical protein
MTTEQLLLTIGLLDLVLFIIIVVLFMTQLKATMRQVILTIV